jgi:hypothetical protein
MESIYVNLTKAKIIKVIIEIRNNYHETFKQKINEYEQIDNNTRDETIIKKKKELEEILNSLKIMDDMNTELTLLIDMLIINMKDSLNYYNKLLSNDIEKSLIDTYINYRFMFIALFFQSLHIINNIFDSLVILIPDYNTNTINHLKGNFFNPKKSANESLIKLENNENTYLNKINENFNKKNKNKNIIGLLYYKKLNKLIKSLYVYQCSGNTLSQPYIKTLIDIYTKWIKLLEHQKEQYDKLKILPKLQKLQNNCPSEERPKNIYQYLIPNKFIVKEFNEPINRDKYSYIIINVDANKMINYKDLGDKKFIELTMNKDFKAMNEYKAEKEKESKLGIRKDNNMLNEVMKIYNEDKSTKSMNQMTISDKKKEQIALLLRIHNTDTYFSITKKNYYDELYQIPNIVNLMSLYKILYGKTKYREIIKEYDTNNKFLDEKNKYYKKLDIIQNMDLEKLLYVDMFTNAKTSLLTLETDKVNKYQLNEAVDMFNSQMKYYLKSIKVQHFNLQKFIHIIPGNIRHNKDYVIDNLIAKRLEYMQMKNLSLVEKNIILELSTLIDYCLLSLKD